MNYGGIEWYILKSDLYADLHMSSYIAVAWCKAAVTPVC